MPLTMVDDLGTKHKVLGKFYDTLGIGHRRVWATYTKM